MLIIQRRFDEFQKDFLFLLWHRENMQFAFDQIYLLYININAKLAVAIILNIFYTIRKKSTMSCLSNNDCSFLYSCVSSKCIHDTVFPLQPVPIIIYILMPLCSGIVNTTGNSMGIFKVLLILLILKYTGGMATMMTQSMVVGASLSNFFSIINRRHPILQTSLVNFNLVYVLIPCSLLGSTFGSLIGKFLPQIVQDGLIMIFFGYFAYNFFRKYRQAQVKQDQTQANKAVVHPIPLQLTDIVQNPTKIQIKHSINHEQEQYYSQIGAQMQAYQSVEDVAEIAQRIIKAPKIKPQKLKASQSKIERQSAQEILNQTSDQLHLVQVIKPNQQNKQNIAKNNEENNLPQNAIRIPSKVIADTKPSNETPLLTAQQQKQQQQWINYQKSIHLFDILMSIGVFFIFEFLVFLVQGKLPFLKFTNCDTKYIVGLVILVIITLIYVYFIRFYIKKRFDSYQKYQIKQQGDLGTFTQYILTILGGFAAGFFQGCLGVGSGIFIMAITMSLPITPAAAIATSGYQILFIGAASLVQGFINGDVKIIDTVFIIGDCAILGGLVTLGIIFYLKDKNHLKVSRILTFIIFLLCVMSFILVVPSIIINVQQNGWSSMISQKFSCKTT